MQEQIKQLEKFQTSFNSVINTTPTLLSEKDWKLRYALSEEELNEYKDACEAGDIVEIFDAILDRLFLAYGDAVAHGLQDYLVAGFNEVVNSNMSKLDKDGKPVVNGEYGVYDSSKAMGKILKSELYFTPKLKQILEGTKPVFPIKKGDKFLCIRDYKMDAGTIAYKAGKKYFSEIDGSITDDGLDTNHGLARENNIDLFFRKL